MDFKSWVGKKAGPYAFEFEASRVTSFAKSIGYSLSEPPTEVPPTFLTVCREAESELFTEMGIDLAQVLHGEQTYSFKRSICVGEILAYTTQLIHCLEKRKNVMILLIFETEFRGMIDRDPIASATTTIIYRPPSPLQVVENG